MFPPLFYLLFGLLLNHGNAGAAQYLFASYGVFGVMAPGAVRLRRRPRDGTRTRLAALKRVHADAAGRVSARENGDGDVVRARSSISCSRLMAFFIGGVRLEIVSGCCSVRRGMLGVLPFCAIGLMIGSKANASASPAFVNLIYLPMAFLVRPVDAADDAAEFLHADRAAVAVLSSGATGADDDRHAAVGRCRNTSGVARGVHALCASPSRGAGWRRRCEHHASRCAHPSDDAGALVAGDCRSDCGHRIASRGKFGVSLRRTRELDHDRPAAPLPHAVGELADLHA